MNVVRLEAWWVALWLGLVTVAALTPTPHFMKVLLHESDRTLRANNRSQHGREAEGSFHTVARSFLPYTTRTEDENLQLYFRMPNDSWSLDQRHQWWLVLNVSKEEVSQRPLQLLLVRPRQQRLIRSGQQVAYFNLTETVMRDSANLEEETFVLQVRVLDHATGQRIRARSVIVTSGVEYGPLLVVADQNLIEQAATAVANARVTHTHPEIPLPQGQGSAGRMRRHGGDKSSGECQLMTWKVDVRELGWQWLMYPYEVSLNLCIGSCPVPLIHPSLNPSNHALVRNLFRAFNGYNNTVGHPDIHCVPIGFRTLTLVIAEQPDHYTLAQSNDLSVSRCGCR